MIDREWVIRAALEAGFTEAGILQLKTLRLLPEVREMCSSGSCQQYGCRWSCPPGCGTLEDCRTRLSRYQTGLLVQTVGVLEDEFDGEGMLAAEQQHKKRFFTLRRTLRERYPDVLALGAGCCTVCPVCTYPDGPCRYPEQMVSSMEAYGLLVQEICARNGFSYYYGKNRISYTSCFLLDPKGKVRER